MTGTTTPTATLSAKPARTSFGSRIVRGIALAAVACLATAGEAAPIAIYDSITGNTATTATYFSDTIWLANQFATDDKAYSLDSVILDLAAAPTGPIVLSVYSDAGTKPDSVLATLISPSPIVVGLNTFTASGVNLAASSLYWAVVHVTTASDFSVWQKYEGTHVTGPGASTYSTSSATAGASWNTATVDFPFMMQVNATQASNVPEIDPGSLGSVMALVTGALGLIERRRVRKA